MSYADYSFYVVEYRGNKLPEEVFDTAAEHASAYIDYVTMRRARNASGDAMRAVQCATCAIAEEIANGEKLGDIAFEPKSGIASETIGNWSRSYEKKAVSTADMQLLEVRKREKAVMYLAPYGLLRARGYRSCCRTP